MKYKTSPQDVAFVYIDPTTGVVTSINVTTLEKDTLVKLRPVKLIPVNIDIAKKMVSERGIERHRLSRLVMAEKIDPILILIWTDGGHVIADGNHRYVRNGMMQLPDIAARFIPHSIWKGHVLPITVSREQALQVNKSWSRIA